MNTTKLAPMAANMGSSSTPVPSADPASESFARIVADVLHEHGVADPTEIGYAIVDAYASRIAAERQASDRAGAELRILVDRDQAKDLVLGQMKTVVGQQVVANARAHAHITHLAGQVEAVRRLLQLGDEPRLVVQAEELVHIIMERQFRGVPDHPMVAGFAPSREFSMGRFHREYADTPVHMAFIGWSVVVGSTHHLPLTSLLEATFLADGRPVPASFLGARGLTLEQLLP